ncbi:hypothetical protein [Specibacter sp. NPDC078709]|uniref:hypothetical protein n=1 Tax=Specibacter sp. NPDC078709 TaxID=3154364 RepID=UPI0034483E65
MAAPTTTPVPVRIHGSGHLFLCGLFLCGLCGGTVAATTPAGVPALVWELSGAAGSSFVIVLLGVLGGVLRRSVMCRGIRHHVQHSRNLLAKLGSGCSD